MGLRTLPLRRPLFRHPSALQTHERQNQEQEKKSLGFCCRILDIRGLGAPEHTVQHPHAPLWQRSNTDRVSETHTHRETGTPPVLSVCARLLSVRAPSQRALHSAEPEPASGSLRVHEPRRVLRFLDRDLEGHALPCGLFFFSDVTKWFQPMISGNVDHVHREPSAGVSGFGLVPQRRFRG